MKLNLGCGLNKLEGYINIDIDEKLNPDVVHDFKTSLPYPAASVDKVVMFHTIEHIEKKFHRGILINIRRVLKEDGELIISYPEFGKVAQYWLDNHKGLREFWEATIYGRQASPSDYHVSAMDSKEFKHLVITSGFQVTKCVPEPDQDFNTVLKAKPDLILTYSQAVLESVWTERS